MFLRSLLLLAVLTTPWPALARDFNALVDKALKTSGLSAQIDQMGSAILSSIPGDALPDPRLRDEASKFIKQSINRQSIEAEFHNSFRDQIDEAALEQVVNFYESRLGRKLKHIHESALDSNNLRNIRESRALVASLSEYRANLYKKLIDTEKIQQTNKDMALSVAKGLLQATARAGEDLKGDTDEILDKLKGAETWFGSDTGRISETALMAYAYTYRVLDDKELQETVVFHDSDAARHFGRAVNQGMTAVVLGIGKALGEAAFKIKKSPGDDGK